MKSCSMYEHYLHILICIQTKIPLQWFAYTKYINEKLLVQTSTKHPDFFYTNNDFIKTIVLIIIISIKGIIYCQFHDLKCYIFYKCSLIHFYSSKGIILFALLLKYSSDEKLFNVYNLFINIICICPLICSTN